MYNTRTFISRKFKFEAAHSLPFHKGKCFYKHGHCFRGEVMISSENLINGMVMDYNDLKEVIKKAILNVADHQDLNTIFTDETYYTTAENLCRFFFGRVKEELFLTNPEIKLEYVSLKETDNSTSIVYNENSSYVYNS